MIQNLKPYPAYKDSGVPWLGQVPEHWAIRRGKVLFRCIDVRSSTGQEELLTVSSDRGVVPRRSASVTMFRAESYLGYKLCWPGDLVINSLWAWSRGLGVSRYHGIVSSAYGVYRLRREFEQHAQFVHEFVRSVPFQWELQVRSKGIWISRLQLTDEAFLGAPFPLPPEDETLAIVRFLKYLDRRIRRYIRAKQKLIKLLEEQRQAIINSAVTRGLDPNVRLKPSGVQWLGDVPAHWAVVRLKFVAARIVDCLHATPHYSDNGQFPAIRTADISPGIVRIEKARRIEADEYARWTERLRPEAADVLYSREGERFGIAASVPKGVFLCVSQRMMVFRIRLEHNPVFVMWLLNSKQVYAQACQDVMGATAPHVNVSTICNYSFALPPRSEQDSLVVEIEQSTKNVSRLVTEAMKEIALLREYRTRLIADVVTGKLDVREAAVRLPEEAGELESVEEIDEEPGDADVDADDEMEPGSNAEE